MAANKFKDRIRIEMPGPGRDPVYNTPIAASWIPFAEVWAEVQDVAPSKAEATANGLRLARDAIRIRIRHLPGLLASMRVVELTGEQRTLSIIGGPAGIFNGREMEMMAERFSS
jgi:head-tail adaptor